MSNQRQPNFKLPRGILLLYRENRPSPHMVQYRVNGERRFKAHATKEEAVQFAKNLAGNLKRDGLAAYRLDADEARAWRAFRAEIGEDADLKAVAAIWLKHGQSGVQILLCDAVTQFLAAKKIEGVSKASLAHQTPILSHFMSGIGPNVKAAFVTLSDINEYLESLEAFATATKRSYQKTIKSFFTWLKNTRKITEHPMDGLKLPKPKSSELLKKPVLSVDQCRALFTANLTAPLGKELLGRLALEAFCGMRNSTASRITADAFDFSTKNITVKADIDKLQSYQYVDNAEANVWSWIKWSNPNTWIMTPRMYANHKARAFDRANIAHPHNVLRRSASTYHIALHGDAGKTIALLTHVGSSAATLFKHYRAAGVGKEQGTAWFSILPPNK